MKGFKITAMSEKGKATIARFSVPWGIRILMKDALKFSKDSESVTFNFLKPDDPRFNQLPIKENVSADFKKAGLVEDKDYLLEVL